MKRLIITVVAAVVAGSAFADWPTAFVPIYEAGPAVDALRPFCWHGDLACDFVEGSGRVYLHFAYAVSDHGGGDPQYNCDTYYARYYYEVGTPGTIIPDLAGDELLSSWQPTGAYPRKARTAALDVSPNGNVHIVWTDNRDDQTPPGSWTWGNYEVQYDRFVLDDYIPPAEPSWYRAASCGVPISQGDYYSGVPAVVAGADNCAHILWRDHRNAVGFVGPKSEIYYAKVPDDHIFSPDEFALRESPYTHYGPYPPDIYPHVAATKDASGSVHTVWVEKESTSEDDGWVAWYRKYDAAFGNWLPEQRLADLAGGGTTEEVNVAITSFAADGLSLAGDDLCIAFTNKAPSASPPYRKVGFYWNIGGTWVYEAPGSATNFPGGPADLACYLTLAPGYVDGSGRVVNLVYSDRRVWGGDSNQLFYRKGVPPNPPFTNSSSWSSRVVAQGYTRGLIAGDGSRAKYPVLKCDEFGVLHLYFKFYEWWPVEDDKTVKHKIAAYKNDGGAYNAPPVDGGPVARAPSPADPAPPPVAADAPSPTASDRLTPSAGDRVSPGASAPEGAGADVPGADLPPNDAPALTSSDNPGGDSFSPAVAAAPPGRSGPLAAAAPARPLACKPNPVTASATVCFNLEAPGRVHLAVYDLSGRRVATLADGAYAAGEHATYWRADVPTGVYIYRLQAGDKVAVKKVVVAK